MSSEKQNIKNTQSQPLNITGVNNRTCLGCSYCELMLYPKEGKKELKCWGKNKLTTITDVNKICDKWQSK